MSHNIGVEIQKKTKYYPSKGIISCAAFSDRQDSVNIFETILSPSLPSLYSSPFFDDFVLIRRGRFLIPRFICYMNFIIKKYFSKVNSAWTPVKKNNTATFFAKHLTYFPLSYTWTLRIVDFTLGQPLSPFFTVSAC